MSDEELYAYAKDIQAPFHLLKETARLKRLPVVNFAAGGIATPADAALMMQLGSDGVFVGSVSSRAPTPLSVLVPLSRPSPTTMTPPSSQLSLRTSARPWLVLTSPRISRVVVLPTAAGKCVAFGRNSFNQSQHTYTAPIHIGRAN